MFYFHIENDTVTAIATEILVEQHNDPSWISRHDITSFEQAEQIAAQATALEARMIDYARRKTYIAVDNGEWCSPRYEVVEAPKVGNKVSRCINGDYYPDGEIVKVSGQNSRIVTTSTGRKYYRRRLSGAWVADKYYSMVSGHVSRLNPEF